MSFHISKSFISSVCPSIWLIELDKLDKRVAAKIAREAFENSNLTTLPPTTTIGMIYVILDAKMIRFINLGPMFGFELMSESSNETFNTSLDLAMFGDVGVRK